MHKSVPARAVLGREVHPKLMAQLAKGDKSGLPKDGILYIPHIVITKDNVEEFHQKLNGLLGK